jgi:hypothetical protein
MSRTLWIALAVGAFLLVRARTVFAAKPGAILSTRPEIQYARGLVAQVWHSHGYSLTVTSGYEGAHSEQSLHKQGLAEDYRTRDVAPGDLMAMIAKVRAMLGSQYDVVYEPNAAGGPHLHVEFDPS